MLILHDYLPSQNAWKVRLLLTHLGQPWQSRFLHIFDGDGQSPEFLARNPAGAVPVLELEDGRMLAESNAILCYLAEGTRYLPSDAWQRAQVLRWLFFEEDYVQNGIATLRHWTMTGKLARRSSEAVAARRAVSVKTLAILERALTGREYLTEAGYTIADLSMFAYVARADEADLPLHDYPALCAWIERVRAQPGFLDEVHPYSVDASSSRELP